jgi:hypothetical protein
MAETTETTLFEAQPSPETQEPRGVRALRVLGIIALVEAIIIMTGIIVLSLLTFLGLAAIVSNLGGTDTGTGSTGGTGITVPEGAAPEQVTPAPEVPVLRLGQAASVRAPDSDARAARITVTEPRYSTKAPDQFSEPPGEKFFLRITVLVENTGVRPFSVSSSEFYLRTPEGERYGEGKALGQSELSSATVNPGEKVRGDVVLDVPSKNGEIVYDAGSGSVAAWRL